MERPLSSMGPDKRNDANRNEQKGRGQKYRKKYGKAEPVGEAILHDGLQGEKVGREEYGSK